MKVRFDVYYDVAVFYEVEVPDNLKDEEEVRKYLKENWELPGDPLRGSVQTILPCNGYYIADNCLEIIEEV